MIQFVKVLEQMLHIETEARQIVENAKTEANTIRKQAREGAKQRVIDGKEALQERMQQEISQIEEEAAARKTQILKDTERHLIEMEQKAKEQIGSTVEQVVALLRKQ